MSKSVLRCAGILFCLLCALPSSPEAQTIMLVKDINGVDREITAFGFQPFQGGFVFVGNEPDTGSELWFTGGTTATTHIIADINPGPASSPNGGPTVINLEGTELIFLAATDGVHGIEPWVSDGTESGTYMLADLKAGEDGSLPTNFTHWSLIGTDRVIFRASSSDAFGSEPFWTRGVAGDVTVLDIVPGTGSSNPSGFVEDDSNVFFSARESTNGRELWRTSTGGTVLLVKDITVGNGDSNPTDFAVRPSGHGVFFVASRPAEGAEIWQSDGTSGATDIVKDLVAGATGSNPYNLKTGGGQTFFICGDTAHGTELCRTDGTSGGTYLLDINSGTGSSVTVLQFGLSAFAQSGELVFVADDGTHGPELFKSTGTGPGTVLIKDIRPGAESSGISDLYNFGDAVYFAANDGSTGEELWKTKLSSANTTIVKDVAPGADGADIALVGAQGGGLYFLASNPERNLWRTLGDSASSFISASFSAGAGTASASISGVAIVGNAAYFSANDGLHGSELWRSDGTEGGTTLVKNISAANGSSDPSNFQKLGDRVVFSAITPAEGRELWISDGTDAGSTLLKDINAGISNSTPIGLTEFNGFIYFQANSPSTGRELWRTDGTAAGTALFADIYSGTNGSSPSNFIVVNNHLIFSATDGDGTELWSTQGVPGDVVQVKDINPGASSSIVFPYFARLGDLVIFDADDGTHGQEPWVTDGTTAGTKLLKDINPGGPSYPAYFTSNGSLVFFTAFDPTAGLELFTSDGTPEGTTLFKDIEPGSGSSSPHSFTPFGTRMLFLASDSDHGTEPWISDGTAAGTVLLKDLEPGPEGSQSNVGLSFYNVAPSGGLYFFTAATSEAGEELWQTDGTEAGTKLVEDLFPGNVGSFPRTFGEVNGRFLLSAIAPGVGTELWSILVDGCPDDSEKTDPGICGCGVSDQDGNQNGVIDCVYGAELLADLKQFSKSFKKIKIPLTEKAKKGIKKKIKAAKSQLKAMSGIVSGHSDAVSVVSPFNLKKEFGKMKKAASAVFKLNPGTYSEKRKLALKQIKKLISKVQA